MFKGLGQMMNLVKQLPQLAKLKEEMERLQQRLGQISAEGDAGAGMVKVRVNGKQEVVACTISEEAFKAGDREVLEEMVRGATNQALERVRQLAAEETRKMAASLGMPAGMGLPGMPDLGDAGEAGEG
jgi:DNA-binding YbaB/EbfC family protein